MQCPYCRTQYTMEQPCFCQSLVTTKKTEPDNAPGTQKAQTSGDYPEPAWAAADLLSAAI